MAVMKRLDPQTERAVRVFLARIPPDLNVERAIVFGSRARGDNRPDSDADLALIFERGNEWPIVELLGGLAFDVLMDTGILVQPVPISTFDWKHPERFTRPGFLRNVAREGIAV
jgi:predicted nucleotidyltransferase